jgi:quercetin dioxygenase-like cupin family protein
MIWKLMGIVGLSLTAILAVTLWLYRPYMPVHAQSQPRASLPAGVVEVLSQRLPTMDGANLTVKLIDVTYAPGAASRPHSHPCVVVGYVVNGTIVSQVKGEAEGTYPAGKAFYEAPNGVHAVSKNASATTPSKLLAIFICDKEGPLTVTASDSH